MDVQIVNQVSQISDRVPMVWDLKVFILRVWMMLSSTCEPRISMILTDESGNRIEALVLGDDCEKFKYATWCESQWFHLRDPRVEVNHDYGSMTPHPFRLQFDSNTSFGRIYYNLPVANFMIYPSFTEIIDQVVDDPYPKDCVGVVTRVGQLEFGWQGPRVQFTLRDLELRSIQCLFYSKDASELIKRFRKDADRHLFVILRCFFIKKIGGYTWLRGRENPSTIKYDQFENESYNDFRNRFPNPVPSEYPKENLMSWFIF